jgi:trans-aconitate methyltransferase
LRALSSAYVERRHKVSAGATLDSAGKRAAFALFYGPLHFLCVSRVIAALEARTPGSLVDIGCGTGTAGAAWALSATRDTRLSGIDRNRWAVAEARWTYQTLGLRGTTHTGDLRRLPAVDSSSGVIAAYLLNEVPEGLRHVIEGWLLEAAANGAAVLIVEPIARAVSPWWDEAATRFIRAGGRSDEWRFAVKLPALLEKFDRAAGLRHGELKCRTIAVNM